MAEFSQSVDELGERLAAVPATAELRLVPVRHHSPACARHLETLIRRDKPEIILIEGPADATPLLPYLAEKDAQAPLALYFYHCEGKSNWLSTGSPDDTAVRHRGFYPMAAFSPEWVAIREGSTIGAEIEFIDMPYADKLALTRESPADSNAYETTLLDDHDLASAGPTARMIELSGCRDFNEWWDRYYESGGLSLEPEQYFTNLLSWCLLLRDAHSDESEKENELRETYMAERVRAAVATGKRVMVITGGFHTEVIAQKLQQPAAKVPQIKSSGERGLYIVPYTLNRLDAANNYAAGIAHAGYYQEVWQQHRRGKSEPHLGAGETVALRVSRALQQAGESVSMPDCIEAVTLSRRLGALRGVPAGRAEILDAMETSYIKDVQGQNAAARIARLMSADVKGRVPKKYPAAPLVEDFRIQCQYFKLPLGPLSEQEKRLDIYRSERHRQISRFLHRLTFLSVPYAEYTAGPNFAAGEDLQRVREIWQLAWSPETEATLTERMAYGGQLEEAALNFLLEQLDEHPRQSPALLIEALRMGLHTVLDRVLNRVNQWLDGEGEFPALVSGLKLLYLAWSSQNALAAQNLQQLEPLLEACFERACLRLSWLGQTNEEDAQIYLAALADLDGLARNESVWADVPLFIRCVQGLHIAPVAAPLRGRAAGILTSRQAWNSEQSEQALIDAFNEALMNPEYLGGFLVGFLPVARGFLIQSPNLIKSMNTVIGLWDEDVFLNALPGLRLAFTALKPRETVAFGQALGGMVGGKVFDEPEPMNWTAEDIEALADINAEVRASLSRWGFNNVGQ